MRLHEVITNLTELVIICMIYVVWHTGVMCKKKSTKVPSLSEPSSVMPKDLSDESIHYVVYCAALLETWSIPQITGCR